ncbi:DUF2332 domain-containing protein [Elioraea sp.]|uniref:DUF2332 domain-containing protein n=1 Tax=Elioraea sp. TaxID=2185103 RepID=UPI003F6F2DFA
MSEEAVRRAFAEQAAWCERLGSPFTSRLCAVIGVRIDRSSAVGRDVLDWPGEMPNARGDALPLRLAGALHALVRRNAAPGLRDVYPPNPLPPEARLWQAVSAAFSDHAADILAWLPSPPQTNEVARASLLFAGLLVVAAETRLPIALHELGASAGLNLNLDRFGYRYGDAARGDPASPVQLAPRWDGPAPPDATVTIVRRVGNDIAPLDATTASGRERLLAYTWADQADRVARIEAALTIAAAHPPPIEPGDAAAFVERHFGAPPRLGETRVLSHSIALQYVTEAGRARIAACLRAAGERATADAPVAWVQFEQNPEVGGAALSLALWPGGTVRILATADAHVREVRWLA